MPAPTVPPARRRRQVTAARIHVPRLLPFPALAQAAGVIISNCHLTAGECGVRSAGEVLGQLVREDWRLVGETAVAGIPKLMMAEAATFPELTRFYYQEVVTRGHRLMAGVIERGIKNGEFRPVNVMVAAKLAMSPLMHAVVARHAFGSCMPEAFDVKKYLDTHIDLYLHGIAKQ